MYSQWAWDFFYIHICYIRHTYFSCYNNNNKVIIDLSQHCYVIFLIYYICHPSFDFPVLCYRTQGHRKPGACPRGTRKRDTQWQSANTFSHIYPHSSKNLKMPLSLYCVFCLEEEPKVYQGETSEVLGEHANSMATGQRWESKL